MERKIKMEVKEVSKVYLDDNDCNVVIDHVSLDVRENEFLVLLGPGECGKTVLLNIIAGLTEATGGEIYIDGQISKGINKSISMIFQKLGMLKWLTVRDNVSLSLKFKGIKKKERYEIAQKYIDLVGLTGFEKHYIRQLSGGMKQRVGIARAFASEADILLMDEPFGQLDAQTRYSMQEEILKIWNKEKKTVIFVTNNIEEAVYLGNRIILFSKRPMKVKDIYDLSDMEYPRDYTSEKFLSVRKTISDNTDAILE